MTHHFETEHWLPFPIERVFLFFANPANLPRIMPPSSGAQLLRVNHVLPRSVPYGIPVEADLKEIAGAGSNVVVSFRVLPFLPFRMEWVSEITEFEWNRHFADVQKKGPFKYFHHRHELRTERGGTIVRDAIDYDMGFGRLGNFGNIVFVEPLLHRTFQYRQRELERLLTTTPSVN